MRVWVLLVLCACSDTEHNFIEVLDCPSCGAGELRHVYRLAPPESGHRDGQLFVAGGRVHYVMGTTLTELDAEGHLVAERTVDLPEGSEIWTAAGNEQGDRYLGVRVAKPFASDPYYSSIRFNLYAFDAQFERRWQVTYGDGYTDGSMSGGQPGPFLSLARADREGAYLNHHAYAASDGHVMYTFAPEGLFGPDGSGGMYFPDFGRLVALDAAGAQRWEKPMVGVAFGSIDAAADGTVSVGGWFKDTPLDLGEVQLAPVPGAEMTYFGALLDANGATQLAYTLLGDRFWNLGQGIVAIGGRSMGEPWLPPDPDRAGFVVLVDRAGVIATDSFLRVPTTSSITVEPVFLAADGSLWATVEARSFRVGSQTVEGGELARYVINIGR